MLHERMSPRQIYGHFAASCVVSDESDLSFANDVAFVNEQQQAGVNVRHIPGKLESHDCFDAGILRLPI